MYNSAYYLKKKFAIFPGRTTPVSATFLTEYYAWRMAQRGPFRAAADWIVGNAFLAWVPRRARKVARKFGFDDAWVKKATAIARARFTDPNDIALFRIERSEDLDHWMRRFESAGVNKLINPANWRADCVLADKRAFAERCAAHGIAHPQLLATIVDGDITVHQQPAVADMVLKPAAGEGGSGVRMLSLSEAERADFSNVIAEHAEDLKGPWLVQQRISNHPQMRDISINAVATVRLTTMFNERGEPEVVTSVLRFASREESLVDNIKAGGLMAPIDAITGVLGAACRGRGIEEFERHPVSNAAIAGRQLPYWPEVIELAKRAHRDAFTEYTMVGWDVVITEDGPLILEGNGKPCMIVAQRAPRQGVGRTRFGELIAHHINRAIRHQSAR